MPQPRGELAVVAAASRYVRRPSHLTRENSGRKWAHLLRGPSPARRIRAACSTGQYPFHRPERAIERILPCRRTHVSPESEATDPAWGERLLQTQDRLERMIHVRMDPRLGGRLDAADVLQECFLEATRRRKEFERQQSMPLIVWLRLLALQKLAEMHRKHLRVQSRSVLREIARSADSGTSMILAAQLLKQLTTPSHAAIRKELECRLIEALESLDVIDRECIVLRNFERMTNAEAASVLGLGESAASSRYVRALQKLREILNSIDELSRSDWHLGNE